MKKYTKWIAFLLAGIMIVAALAACGNEDSSNKTDDETKDNNNEQNEPASQYENLTPAELMEALQESDTFTVVYEIIRDTDAEKYTYLRTYVKNGDIMKYTDKITSSESTSENESYADLKNQLVYAKQDESWIANEQDIDLIELLKGVLFTEFLMNNDSYLEYDAESGRYPMKEEVLRTEFEVEAGIEISGYRSVKNSTYTFFFASQGTSYNITLDFTAEEITLPEVSAPAA